MADQRRKRRWSAFLDGKEQEEEKERGKLVKEMVLVKNKRIKLGILEKTEKPLDKNERTRYNNKAVSKS